MRTKQFQKVGRSSRFCDVMMMTPGHDLARSFQQVICYLCSVYLNHCALLVFYYSYLLTIYVMFSIMIKRD